MPWTTSPSPPLSEVPLVFFVGTDAGAYMPSQNFLIDIVGIKAGTPDLVGCAIAGSSTALGFVSAQSAFNVVYPAGKLWND